MQTDLITLTCENNTGGFICTTNSTFSGGEMFISLMLILIFILGLMAMIKSHIFAVSVHKEYTGNNTQEGKEHFKL